MRAVLDTNVLISATFWRGDSFSILKLVEEKKIVAFSSLALLAEYLNVVNSVEIIEKTAEKQLASRLSFAKLSSMLKVIETTTVVIAVKEDPDDNKVLECAIDSNADFVITQDNHLLKLKEFNGVKIVSPKQALKLV
ncbi:putative toxin-antitoxin system toxin component, PIN family [Candidatus Micrarchaeota archaeon]|nr:putative toxin-antitoxin system toxin component, PIN family [Candidatus Micrarchaeota archaeon]